MQDLCVWVILQCILLKMHRRNDADGLRFFWHWLIGVGCCGSVRTGITGIPVLRLKGDYPAIVTLALGDHHNHHRILYL